MPPRTVSVPPPTVGDLLTAARRRLTAAAVEEAATVADLLLAYVLGCDRTWLYAHPEAPVAPAVVGRFAALLDDAARHQPLAYLIGEREFLGRSFLVRHGVLVPRPETEVLVEVALARLTTPAPKVADVGCGCGAIAVSVALERPDATVLALDVDQRATSLARANALRLGARNVLVVRGDLLAPVRGPLDAVLANLPYIPSSELAALPPVVRAEPRHALDGGPDGLALYRCLLPQARAVLRPGGLCAFEIAATQGAAARALAHATWPAARVQVLPDYAGRDRVVLVEL